MTINYSVLLSIIFIWPVTKCNWLCSSFFYPPNKNVLWHFILYGGLLTTILFNFGHRGLLVVNVHLVFVYHAEVTVVRWAVK